MRRSACGLGFVIGGLGGSSFDVSTCLGEPGRRKIFLSGRGFRVLRVWNNDVLFRMGAVLEAILSELTAPHHGELSRACPSPASGRG
jgi:hypothetical protein